MSDERKPSDDLKEGLGLILRAAKTAVKQVDVSKIDKGLDKAISQATRVATNVGRAVADEVNRMSTSNAPPWQSRKSADTPKTEEVSDDKGLGDEGEGHVWASQAQQSAPEDSTKAEGKQDEKPPAPKVRVETEVDDDAAKG